MLLKDVCSRLSDEQKSKIDQCKSFEDIAAFVSTLDFELTDEELEGIVGGRNWTGENLDLFRLNPA